MRVTQRLRLRLRSSWWFTGRPGPDGPGSGWSLTGKSCSLYSNFKLEISILNSIDRHKHIQKLQAYLATDILSLRHKPSTPTRRWYSLADSLTTRTRLWPWQTRTSTQTRTLWLRMMDWRRRAHRAAWLAWRIKSQEPRRAHRDRWACLATGPGRRTPMIKGHKATGGQINCHRFGRTRIKSH